ncbi:hypothetical protein MNBD_DELTA02-1110 [hydrothermal vent metagenome]|uniref:Sce7726 family protein n=1 Tax=hydrothermal vent metagenome TaxID=652676 RepID=A0A3B0V6E5_9ZZZZ
MKDIDIRKILLDLITDDCNEPSQSLVVEELGLCQGNARIDIAVINSYLHGYEIKSARDTLGRLSSQIESYNKIFDHITLVVSTSHLEKSLKQIPDWWGVCEAKKVEGGIQLNNVRPCGKNTDIDPLAVAQLLWRDEALETLEEYDFDKGFRSKPRSVLWERLATQLTLKDLQTTVRDKLKARDNWRSAPTQV